MIMVLKGKAHLFVFLFFLFMQIFHLRHLHHSCLYLYITSFLEETSQVMLLPMSNAVLIPVQFRLDWRSFVMVNHDLFRFSTSLGFIAKVWLN